MADWSAKHGPASGTLNAATGLMAISSLASLEHVGPGWPLLAGGVMSVGGVIGGLAREDEEKLTGGALVFRVASWLGAGGWMSYALTYNNPINPTTVGVLAGSAAFMGVVGAHLANRKRKRDEKAQAVADYLAKVGTANEWADRIDRVCNLRGTKVIAVDDKGWPKDAGFSLEVELPSGGHTYRTIKAFSDGLASDAKLPEGCGVEVGPGVNRGLAVIKVSLINALDGEHPVPLDVTPLDFEKHFDIGKERDSSLALINLREFSAMLVGQKGAGKTNQLRVIMTRLLRMPNLLVWIIDYNGGGLATPWMKAWDEAGRPGGRPPVDWVATDDAEALCMTAAAVAIAKHRKIVYQTLMYEANTDLLPMTPELPGILIISDEGAEFLGQQTLTGSDNAAKRKVAANYMEVLRIARSVGVNELTCGLRATTDVFGDPMVKSQSRVKIGLMMENQDEIAYLVGWEAKVTPQDMPDRGYGVYADGETGVVKAFKGYRVLPEHMRAITVGTAHLRAALDEESLKAAGDQYEGRWQRAEWLEAMKLAPVAVGSGGASTPPVSIEKPAPDPISDAFDGAPRDPETAKREVQEAMANAGGGDEVPDYRDEFERIMKLEGMADWDDPGTWSAALPEPTPPTDDEDDSEEGGLDFKTIVFGVVKASGEDGIKPADIHRALSKSFAGRNVPVIRTITRWLQADERVHQPSFGHYAIKPKPKGRG
jgi:hypothetical protein